MIILKDADLESLLVSVDEHENVMSYLRQREYGNCRELKTIVNHRFNQFALEIQLLLILINLGQNMSEVENLIRYQPKQLHHETRPLFCEVKVLFSFHVPE